MKKLMAGLCCIIEITAFPQIVQAQSPFDGGPQSADERYIELEAVDVYVAGKIPGTMVHMDPDTVRDRPAVVSWRPFPVRQAWFKSIEMPTATRWTKETKQLISVSCEMEKIAILKAVEYLPNDRIGGSFEQDDVGKIYNYAVPGSVGYDKLKVLCGH